MSESEQSDYEQLMLRVYTVHNTSMQLSEGLQQKESNHFDRIQRLEDTVLSEERERLRKVRIDKLLVEIVVYLDRYGDAAPAVTPFDLTQSPSE